MKFAQKFSLAKAMEEVVEQTTAAQTEEEAAAAAAAAAQAAEEEAKAAENAAAEKTELSEEEKAAAAATEPAAVEEPVEIPLVEDSEEEAVADVEMTSNEVEAASEVIENVQSDAETLSDLADKMEEANATGGMDASAASIAQVAVEHFYNKLSIAVRPMPALESFGGDSSRQKATILAVENIREQVKNVMQALIVMIKKAYEFVKGFIKSALDANGKIKARAEALLEALDKVKGSAQEDTVTGSFVANLAYGDKVDADKAVKAAGALVEAADKLTNELFNAIKPNQVVDFVVDPEAFGKFEFKGFNKDGWSDAGLEANEGFKVYALGGVELSAGRKLTVAVKAESESGKESFDALAGTRVQISSAEETKAESASTLTIEEAKTVVKAVIANCDQVAKAESDANAVEAFLKGLSDEVAKAGRDVKEDATATARAKTVHRVLMTMSSIAVRPMVLSIKNSIVTGKAALDYAAKSAKAYGVEKEKVEETAAA
jgi:hypothetical protein